MLLVEGVWGLVVLVLGVAGRVLLRRPWVVEAKSSDGASAEWRIKGWTNSGRAIDEIAEALRRGARPPFSLAKQRARAEPSR